MSSFAQLRFAILRDWTYLAVSKFSRSITPLDTSLVDEEKRSHAAMNSAAITGPMTKPFRPKSDHASERRDEYHIVGYLGIFADKYGPENIID